eukprot:GHVR01111555.1.p2 GENE.GHVR01111555.1~~GHVR01111555.1.p2  ORF type:complete len:123 (+),score=58.74 GHVR01111555.1:333-701(+)
MIIHKRVHSIFSQNPHTHMHNKEHTHTHTHTPSILDEIDFLKKKSLICESTNISFIFLKSFCEKRMTSKAGIRESVKQLLCVCVLQSINESIIEACGHAHALAHTCIVACGPHSHTHTHTQQ